MAVITLNRFDKLNSLTIAMAHSLIGLIARADDDDGYKYLRALLVQLPKAQSADDYEALLPWNIALALH